ncbi:MAG TPA: GGDEF domain-containing protein, partial [Acidobacteriaceae bacterium]|nr:GGDEF domain-containing protein [Acidobacteriaceae bacterium]
MSASPDQLHPLHAASVPVLLKEPTLPLPQPTFEDPFGAAEVLVATIRQLSRATTFEAILILVRSAARLMAKADSATVVLNSGDDRHTPFEADAPAFFRSTAMAPIRAENPLGAIHVYWVSSHAPASFELRLLHTLADSASGAMERIQNLAELEARVQERTEQLETRNKELRAEAELRKQMEAKVLRLSLTDDLTGLNNRRGFLMRTEQMLKLVHRMETHAWLFYIDLDGL